MLTRVEFPKRPDLTSLKSSSVYTLTIILFLICSHGSSFTLHSHSCSRNARIQKNNYSKNAALKARQAITPETSWPIRPIGLCRSPFKECFGTPRQATVNATVIDLGSDNKDGDDDSSPTSSSSQSSSNGTMLGYIELFEGFGYEDALDSLDGFSHVWVISYLHLTRPRAENPSNKGWRAKVRPRRRGPTFLTREVGLFSTRAPHRPNSIGLSALRLVYVDRGKRTICVEGLDLIDDTPILDIKPYIPAYDSFPGAKYGWLENNGDAGKVDDPDHQKHPPPHKSRLLELIRQMNKGVASAVSPPVYLWSLDFSALTIRIPGNDEDADEGPLRSFSFPYSSDEYSGVGKKSGRKQHEQLSALKLIEMLSEEKCC